MFRWVFRLDTRVTLDVPLCSAHRDDEKAWHWIGAMMLFVGFAVLALIFTPRAVPDSLRTLTGYGTYLMLFGGAFLVFSKTNTLHVVEVNTAFSAYDGFGVEYMKKMPHDVQIFPPKYGGAAFASTSESDRRDTRSAPTFSTDLL